MNETLAELCKGSNINLMVAAYAATLVVEWWLPKSRFKANSIGDVVVGLAGFAILLVAVVVTAIFRRIHGTGSRETRNQGNQGSDRRG